MNKYCPGCGKLAQGMLTPLLFPNSGVVFVHSKCVAALKKRAIRTTRKRNKR